jgi:response regulator RpfG family c-di-GMP phosphodiesterase
MTLKILIADPDEKWRLNASECFKNHLYNVDTVISGKNAQLAVYNERYFMIIIDINIEQHSIVPVVKYIKSNHPSQNIIVTYGHPQTKADASMQTDEDSKQEELFENLRKYGVNAIVSKDMSFEEIERLFEDKQNINEIIMHTPENKKTSEEVEIKLEDDKFTKISINEFYSNKVVLFDVFIKISDGHYIKILHKGDSFLSKRIDHYKNTKDVKFLYYQVTDRKKYFQLVNHLSVKAGKSDKLANKAKVGLLKLAAECYLDEVSFDGLKPIIIEQGKELCANICTVIEYQKDLYQLLREFADIRPEALPHSFAVTFFTAAIIEQFEWKSKKTLEMIAMASMFHDIGKINLPKEIIDLRPRDMTPEQLLDYQQHPLLSNQVLDGKIGVDASLKQIIYQHHECFDGSGFPRGIKGGNISLSANILCLASDFTHMMTDENIPPMECFKRILSDKSLVVKYHSSIIERFIKSFVDPKMFKKMYKK